MTVGLHSTNVAEPLLNTLRGTSTSYASTWIQLHTGDPSSAGTAAVSVGSTNRYQATFAAATSSGASASIALSASPTAWTNGGTSETISYISVWSASTAGNPLWTASLSVAKTWASADTLTLNTCGLSLTPLAV